MLRRVLKPCLQGARFCTQCVFTLGLWTLWLGLAVLLVVQLRLLGKQELEVPEFMLRRVERELAGTGLRVEIGHSTFDPAGSVLLENVRLVTPTFDDPLLTARRVFIRLDPWALAVRSLDVSEAHLEGVTCFLPAMVSPSGRAEPLLGELTATLRPGDDRRTLTLVRLDARIGRLAIDASGSLPRPGRAAGQAPATTARAALSEYLRFGRRLAELLPELEAWENPRLSLRVEPGEEPLVFVRAELLADRFERAFGADQMTARSVHALTRLPLGGDRAGPVRLEVSAAELASQRLGRVRDARVQLEATYHPGTRAFAPRAVDLTLAEIERPELATGPVRLQLAADHLPALRGDAAVEIGGVPWTLSLEGDAQRRSGTLRVAGTLPHALIELVGRLAKRDLGTLLVYDEPATLRAEVTFADGGRPAAARGRLDSGFVNVRGVPLDATGSDFFWDGTRVVCDNLLLRQGESEARGSYAMDTRTNDYRFLLTGRLRPQGIGGWFHDWWPRFWNDFDFSAFAPQAEVDIAGRWGEPRLSQVFVLADADQPKLRGVAFDRVRTRVFVRPQFYDDLDFLATRGAQSARGSFTRTVDLEVGTWRSMEFAVKSDLELSEAGRLFGREGTELLEPFRFATPPKLELSGRLDGPASPGGPHTDVHIVAASTGRFAFHQFPVEDLRFSAHLKDDELKLEKLALRFAGGEATGRVELRGQGKDRRLGVDAVLTGARLGEAIRTLEQFGARRRGEAEPPQSKFQHRLARGRLDVALSAEGLYADPASFRGRGNAEVSGADLGEINLFGILSSMLRRTLFDFTTLQLDHARANFTVDGNRLAFSEFKLTGPRAAIEARGDYYVDTKTMAFNAKVFPFEESSGLLGSAVGVVLTPLSNALEVKLSGQLENPSWTFVYGPANLLRTLIGSGPTKEATTSAPPAAPTGPVPAGSGSPP